MDVFEIEFIAEHEIYLSDSVILENVLLPQ